MAMTSGLSRYRALSGAGARDEQGQAITEYIVMVAVVISLFLMLARGLDRMGLADKLVSPVREDFARAYRYGHPKALGYEDGGPKFHPRAIDGEGSFRFFINPRFQ